MLEKPLARIRDAWLVLRGVKVAADLSAPVPIYELYSSSTGFTFGPTTWTISG